MIVDVTCPFHSCNNKFEVEIKDNPPEGPIIKFENVVVNDDGIREYTVQCPKCEEYFTIKVPTTS